MSHLVKLFFFPLFILASQSVLAQQANPNNIGSVKGLLQDTVHKYSVKSATVSVYRSDSTLINYMLSNNYGEFSFKNLPLGGKYYVEISHISYEILRRSFTISNAQPVDLKTIIMKPRQVTLKEVQVQLPPVQMNGDTLEFNAAAFKLDSNAVVEDLLRKIPNITLWGDGQITVNGREIKSLLVNGKEFFGGDLKMATQNISKNALQKIQVYAAQKDEANPLDSTLTMNLKLKKGKDRGHFGKIGGGYGTLDRFEGDASFNFYGPKMQLGFIGASNNTNKIANSTRSLTANSTFKGTGINVEYQPDFRAAGISRTNTGGITFSYNFIEKPDYQNRKELKSNYFVQNRDHDIISNSNASATVDSGATVFTNTYSKNNNLSTSQNLENSYEYSSLKHRLTINNTLSVRSNEGVNKSDRQTRDDLNALTSTNNVEGHQNSTDKTFNLTTNYRYTNSFNTKQKIRSYNARYSLNVSNSENERTNLTQFTSFIKPADSRIYDRKYNTNGNDVNQRFFVELPGLKRLFFGDKKFANIEFSISNDIDFVNSSDKNVVADLDKTSRDYLLNTYLTNNLRTNTLNEAPALTVSKTYSKRLSNRFYTYVTLSASAKQKFSFRDNRSDKQIQNISRSYTRFIPGATINYYRYQYGEYSNQLNISYTNDIQLPTVEQLAPLTDSSNVYRIERGNLNLREAKRQDVNVYFYHSDQRTKNTLNYSINASVSFMNDSFADSSFVDRANKSISYTTNVDGYKSASFNTDIRKSLKFKTNALQIGLAASGRYSRNPGYVNALFNYADSWNTTSSLTFNYTYKGKLALETKESFNYSESKQSRLNTNYGGRNISSALSGSYNVTKKFTLNSNVSLNASKASRSAAINYNIWNASAIYRFMKGNNAEIKLTALDILRENQSIINSGNDRGGFTFSQRNVLRQYFMTTFSYYPRQFGKSAAKR